MLGGMGMMNKRGKKGLESAADRFSSCLSAVCGKPVNPVTERQRIIGGQIARPGNFPWQAFTTTHGRGGGALLGDRWILTAAHTIYPKNHNKGNDNANPKTPVFLGHTNVEQIQNLEHHPVRRVIIHPDYRQDEPNNFEGDIALLELENSVTLGPDLLPICLPDNETFYGKGLMGYVSGFGITEDKLAFDLRFVRLPVADREACQRWLRTKKDISVFSQNMFCSGDPAIKQDACQGDSGGVFAVRDRNRDIWVATGIVSWGIGCGEGYGFYTKILNYVDWIKKEMGDEN